MSDIIVTCTQCGNNITVSEHVSAEFIPCMKCKNQVPIPARLPDTTVVVPKLKLALARPPEPAPPPEPPPSAKLSRKAAKEAARKNVQQYMPQGGKKRIRARKVSTFEIKVLPWLVFIVLLLVAGWMRHVPGALAPDIHAKFIQGGVLALLLLHVSVVCLAFGDDAFSGILCFIIPGYTIYYLFTQADQILLRGLTGALLIVFGWDFAIAAGELWNEFYTNASSWIATTDTIKKK